MKTLVKIITTIIFFLSVGFTVYAETISDDSARILSTSFVNLEAKRFSQKKLVMNRILKQYNSPLLGSVDAFLSTCVLYDLDCYLLPSITGLESSFGKFTHPGSNNPFGWGGGYIMFDSWDQAIDAVGKGLRYNYINKGADSVEKIAPIYAASLTWAPRVQYFMNVFEREEDKIDSPT